MSPTEVSEWALLKAGDEAGLSALFRRHQARVFRHASRLLSVREDAKDVVTITFFELWRRRTSVRLVDGSPLPWLLNTATNVARNIERSRRRYHALLMRVPAPVVPAAESVDETGVLHALMRLPTGQRSVVVLTVLEGFPDREVAQALGVSLGTVKSRLSRARAKLREDLDAMEAS